MSKRKSAIGTVTEVFPTFASEEERKRKEQETAELLLTLFSQAFDREPKVS